jgi:hypothetical protein
VILTNGRVTEDGVEAHNDLLAEFPISGDRAVCPLLVEPPTSQASISLSTAAAISTGGISVEHEC